jgi:hypothetical protein
MHADKGLMLLLSCLKHKFCEKRRLGAPSLHLRTVVVGTRRDAVYVYKHQRHQKQRGVHTGSFRALWCVWPRGRDPPSSITHTRHYCLQHQNRGYPCCCRLSCHPLCTAKRVLRIVQSNATVHVSGVNACADYCQVSPAVTLFLAFP